MNSAQMYERLLASDPAYNGKFYIGVVTTGIYCLPSCTARKPKPENVRFFESEAEAVSFGLRPCKRCKPDQFGMHLEEGELERVVARCRANPEAYASTEEIAAEIGCGSSRLTDLFRRYFHATPSSVLIRARIDHARKLLMESDRTVAEIAFDSGYDSTSAFYDAFVRATGMTPSAYRELDSVSEFTVSLPPDFSIGHWKAYLDRDSETVSEKLHGNRWLAAIEDRGGLAGVALEISESEVRVKFERVRGTISGEAVHERIARLLGLNQDLRGFAAMVGAEESTRRLLSQGQALRIPQTQTVWDGIQWAIIGQQMNFNFAARLRARLSQLAGEKVGSFWTTANLERTAALTPADLMPLQFSQRKAEYLVDAARAAVEGTIDYEELPEQSATKVERTLLAMRGFGPWSVNYAMMRSCGFMDCTPLGDTGLTSGLQKLFALDIRPGEKETKALMERFAPYRSLATYHIWRILGAEA